LCVFVLCAVCVVRCAVCGVRVNRGSSPRNLEGAKNEI
jgi:hypothetical protein